MSKILNTIKTLIEGIASHFIVVDRIQCYLDYETTAYAGVDDVIYFNRLELYTR